LANFALPLGQKTGLLSLVISHYITINNESNIKLSDGSSGHLYSFSASPEQLNHLNVPSDKGFDGVLITTKQQKSPYFVVYATERGRMSEFETILQNILGSVKLGSVGFSGSPSATK
jgi:hypothetical protein